MRMVRQVYTIIQGVIAVLAGMYGLLITIGQYLNWKVEFLPKKEDLAPFILAGIAVLLIEVGFEHVIHFDEQNQRLDKQDLRLTNIESFVGRSLGGQYLKSSAEVYAAGTRLTASTERRLRTIVYGRGAKGTRQWAEMAAQRLRHLKNIGVSPEFHVVVALDMQNVPANFQAEMDQRVAVFVRHGVGDVVSLYLLDVKAVIGCDVYIIDKAHVFINPVPFPGIDTQRAILFENQSNIAEDYAEWFDNSVRAKAISYDVWRNQQTAASH